MLGIGCIEQISLAGGFHLYDGLLVSLFDSGHVLKGPSVMRKANIMQQKIV